jgi:hypothetical protein
VKLSTLLYGSISYANHEQQVSPFTYSIDSVSVASDETAITIGANTKSNNFILGFDCEVHANADIDGMNTVNKDIYWLLTHEANSTKCSNN